MTEIRLDSEADGPGETDRPRARRRRWTAAHLVAVMVLTGAVAYFVEAVGGDPDDIVVDYLAAVHDADPDTALSIAGARRVENDPRDVFLDVDALSDDWEITSVATRRQSGDAAIVNAVITGPDGERAGVFRLERRGSGWRIGNPFVPLYLSRPPLWVDGERERNRLTVNGKSITVPEAPEGLSGDGGIQLRLFPGTYAFFADDPLVEPVDASRTWLPPGDSTSLVPYTPRLDLTGKSARAADTAVRDVLRTCAATTEPQPHGCPFGIGATWSDDDGTEHRLDDAPVEWKVTDMPRLFFADTGFGCFQPVSRKPFTVGLTFTSGGERRTVDAGVDMSILTFGMSTNGEVVFTDLDGPGGCG